MGPDRNRLPLKSADPGFVQGMAEMGANRRIMNAANRLWLRNRFDFGPIRVFFVTVEKNVGPVRMGPQPTAPLSILH